MIGENNTSTIPITQHCTGHMKISLVSRSIFHDNVACHLKSNATVQPRGSWRITRRVCFDGKPKQLNGMSRAHGCHQAVARCLCGVSSCYRYYSHGLLVVVVTFHPLLGRLQWVVANGSCLVPSLLPPHSTILTPLLCSSSTYFLVCSCCS